MGGKAAKADESAALPADEVQGNELSESEAAASSGNAEKAASSENASGGIAPPIDGRVAIVSKTRAGKKIIARTGEVIEFGADGKASVRAEDAVYLAACSGFEFE